MVAISHGMQKLLLYQLRWLVPLPPFYYNASCYVTVLPASSSAIEVVPFSWMLLKNLSPHAMFTTAYHLQTNGLIEHFNRALGDTLSMYVGSNHTTLDLVLPFVTYACNTAPQATTVFLPFLLSLRLRTLYSNGHHFSLPSRLIRGHTGIRSSVG